MSLVAYVGDELDAFFGRIVDVNVMSFSIVENSAMANGIDADLRFVGFEVNGSVLRFKKKLPLRVRVQESTASRRA